MLGVSAHVATLLMLGSGLAVLRGADADAVVLLGNRDLASAQSSAMTIFPLRCMFFPFGAVVMGGLLRFERCASIARPTSSPRTRF